MIVATAGHIDHGKTSLVRALSGVDTDRLPEEKARGMSIDLGFAYVEVDGQRLGFVDVPGHERFVRNMIAGVSGIDFALLTVAADDGVMPQTREHLAIVDLLGIGAGAVALTKIDRASPERVAAAIQEVRALLEGATLADAPVFAVSSITGQGVEQLRAHLAEAARATGRDRAQGAFRMTVDRTFIIDGAGIVVTGLVLSGEAAVNDRLLISPSGTEVRVRAIHAHNRKADSARAGERCALNISASRLTRTAVARGDWLLDARIHAPTERFDVRLRVLGSESHPLRHWTPTHLHIGAADVPARVAILSGGAMAPGADGFAQLVLSQPISALHGDPFILRDQSASRTIAGGLVVDPFAPSRGRARPERLALLPALERAHLAASLAASLERAPKGFAFGRFQLARNLDSERGAQAVRAADAVLVGDGREALAYTRRRWDEILEQARAAIAAGCEASGGARLTLAQAQRRLQEVAHPQAAPAVLEQLVGAGFLEHAAGGYRLHGAQAQLEPKDADLWKRVEPLIDVDSLRPPSVAEIAAQVRQEARMVERLLNRAARLGLAVQVAANRYYPPHRLLQLAEIAEATAAEDADGVLQVRAYRDRSGIGRNLVIEVLEHFDRAGFTHRAGEHRRILKPAAEVTWVRVQA